MTKSNSRKHARKVTLDAAVNNAIEKAVDARKVAAFTVGAAGVLAGAAFAFGATPAMAAETGAATEPTKAPVAAGDKAGADAGKSADGDADTKPEEKEADAKEADAKEADKNNQADANKETGDKAENTNKQAEQPVVKTEDKKSDEENQKQETNTVVGQDRDASTASEPKPQANNTINLSKDTKDNLPNMYAWGKSNNVYIEDGQNKSVTINFARPDDGYTITKVAIFPSDGNTVDNKKSRGFLEYYSDPNAKDEHKPYSGIYDFKVNTDGTATLTMSKLYRDGNLKSGESYSANRCIYLYGTDKDGKTVVLYKTNIVRAATLIPPKTAGSIVLQYDEKLNEDQIQAKLKQALDAPTEATGNKSIREQIKTASTATGVGGRTGANGAFVQTPDDPDKKIVITDNRAYDPSQVAKINTVTSKEGQPTTYVAGAQTLKTYLVSDLGYKSEPLALTVARYDTRIDKPVVDDVDINKLTPEQKTEIIRKLAHLNHVPQDKVTFNENGEAVINFDGVDSKDAPKIPLRELVLKKIAEKDISVPAADKAVFVTNPLAYSDAEIKSIKKAIYEANKGNQELGLSENDYENQISLSYLTGNLTATGDSNKGISNGQAENTITVKIKTDKAVAEFKSDVKARKLTKLPDIRKDYNVTWTTDKINGRASDEGLSWSEDHKTIIYRYDPTKAEEFDTNKILGLLKATPKDPSSGLRELTGGEAIDHEGADGKAKKSHVGYALKDDQPTTELSLGNMDGAYWKYSRPVDNSGVDLGDAESNAGKYSWDEDAKPVVVAAKQDKVYKARLFVLPYGLTMYRNIYMENGNQPWNTPKAINVIFVPQTNHKTSDLQKSIGEHKTETVEGKDVPTQHEYYNASDKVKSDYDDALKVAKALYEQVKNTKESDLTEKQKADIDNATIKLDKARKALDGADTNKDGLDKSIEANGKTAEGTTAETPGTVTTDRYKNVSNPDFLNDDGKPDTAKNEKAKAAKKAYDEALAEANKVKEDKNATQKAVDEAKAKLDEARKKLNDFTTNKDELNNAIAQHGKVNTGDADKQGEAKLKTADPTYQNSTKEERDAYDKAVAEADKVSKDPNASQKEVNEAIKKLKDAKDALDKNATDKAPLDAAVQKSFDNPDPTKPDKQSVFYKNAAAKKDTDPDAKKAVEDYDKALAEAKRVLGDKNATKADVDKAKKDLEDAEAALHADKYSTDKTDLGKALADNFSGYLMPAYFNAFDKAQAGDEQAKKDFKAYNDAYHAAKDLMTELNKPNSTITQEDVEKVKKQLLDARKIIDTYATDTSRLSAAVFNDIAIKASPAYKNLKALAEKTNPTPEEQADVEAAKKAMEAYKKAADKLHNAITNKLPRDKANGQDIPDSNIPVKDGDLNDKDYLKDIQAHKNGEPLNRDVDSILQEMNEAAKALDKFATKTDELIKSINEDANTHPSPAFKNASLPSYKNDDGSDNTDKNNAAKKAVDAYGEALNKAKEKLNDPNATQKDINDAKAALDKARTELDKYNTDITKLKESVKKHGTKEAVPAPEEGTLTSDAYRNASDPHFLTPDGKPDEQKNKQAATDKKAYDAALLKAQELLKKADPDSKTPLDAQPTQKEIDEALKNLDDARKKLEDNYKTVTTDLENEIKKSTPEHASVTEDDFENTPEFKNANDKKDGTNENADVKAYKEALKKARDLAHAANPTDPNAKNSSHPTQKQINDALDALKQAKQAITDGYKTDVDKLKQAKEYADGAFKNTPEYKNATAVKNDNNNAKHEQAGKDLDGTDQEPGLSKLVEKITAKLQDTSKMTQKEVDALVKQLVTAQKKITENYKTNTDALKNEVGDKDAQGQPVTPPFEASVAYKNALEKRNAESEEDAKKPDSATAKLNAYADKLKAANDLINKVNNPDPNAKPEDRPTQDDVDKALAALKQAKKDIDDNFKTKVDKLQNEVDDKNEDGSARTPEFEKSTEFANLKAKIDGDKKPDDLVAYEQALAKAKELIDKNDGEVADPTDPTKKVAVPKDQLPTQQEVDEAKKALKEIKDKILANYKTSPVELQNEVDKSKDGDDDTRDGLFEQTPAFKNVTNNSSDAAKKALDDYNEKLKTAKEMLEKFDRTTGKPKKDAKDVPTQQELDAALKALQDAKKKIEDDYSTSKSDLRQEAGDDFTKSPEYQNAQAKGDDASKQALEDYKKALDDANSVLADPNATQAEVDAALKRLQDAKSKLRDENGTDKSKLQAEADDDANFRNSPYFIIGNKADIEAYEDALAEAKSVLADPNATQAQVDAALKKLEEAKKRILDFLSHFGGSGNGTGDWNGYGFVNGHESYGALVDKTALQIEVNNAVETSANTAEAVVYRQALAEARSVLNDPNATQAQVDAALRKLQAAKAALLNSLSGASGHKIAKTGAATGLFAGFAAIFAGLGAAGVASRRRKHSNE
ncbi:peptidase [Bifidobacteriaceae bacterium NR044]|nr:peptidase [Bifidobacteriaceae bacterium NR043]MBF9353466.1 peptidase [Bifidobacteriaceae bacterium NR044]